MANIHEALGNDFLIYIESGSTWVPVAAGTSANVDVSKDVIEIQHKGGTAPHSVWKSSLSGQAGWSLSADGVYLYEALTGTTQSTLFDYMIEGENVLVKIAGRDDYQFHEPATGDDYYEGYGIVTSLSLSFPNNDVATYSVTITGTGELEKKQVA